MANIFDRRKEKGKKSWQGLNQSEAKDPFEPSVKKQVMQSKSDNQTKHQ